MTYAHIIIEHGTTKREFDFPFNIAGHADDLRFIANEILSRLDAGNFHTGWIPITRKQASISNTAPKKWKEP